MGVSERQIIRELQRTTDLTKQDIRRLYHKAAAESVQDARHLYLAKGKAPDWQPMEYLVQAMWEQTAGKLDNLSGTTAIGKAYRQIVDEAVTAVTMGVEDYNSAIRNSLRLLGRAGLQTEYESGHHRRLESAVRQNILDGVRQVQQQAQKLIGEQIGADGVEITAHPNSAPDHEPVQGRQFLLAEFEKMQAGADFQDADGKTYAGFSRPITQWRCRHLVYYILLGAAKRMYTDEQLRKWEEENHKGCEIDGRHYTRYEATQLMRRLETEIRKEKDTVLLAQASGDDVLRRSSQVRVTQLTAKYEQVAESAGLRTGFEKTRVAGYSPKHAKEAAQYQKYLQFIQNDAMIKSKSGLPKKLIDLPNEVLQYTVNIDVDKTEKLINGFHAVAPRGSILTSVQVMAGAGTSTPIRDLKRLYMQYNLSPDKWQKKSGTAFGDGFHYVIHWYEHGGVIPIDEIKLKGMKKNK